jgi:hypothetical protein
MKKNVIVLVIFIIIYIIELIYITKCAADFEVNELFYAFTLFPLLIVLIEGLVGGISSSDRYAMIFHLLYPILVFLIVTFYLDHVFTQDVIEKIYINSGQKASSVQVVKGSQISNMISTCLILLGISIFGSGVGKTLSRLITKNRG